MEDTFGIVEVTSGEGHKELDDMPTIDTLFIDASTGKAIGQDEVLPSLPSRLVQASAYHSRCKDDNHVPGGLMMVPRIDRTIT